MQPHSLLDSILSLSAAVRILLVCRSTSDPPNLVLTIKHLYTRSNLLDPSCEPFEVLPAGRLGPALTATLWMLSAPHRAFSQWRSAQDAVDSMHEARAGGNTAKAALGVDVSHGDARPSVLASVHPDSEAVEEACSWLSPDAVRALLHAVEARAACYPAGAAAPRLAAFGEGGASSRTRLAALTLVAEEQQVLNDCLSCLRTNYKASPSKKRSRPSDTL